MDPTQSNASYPTRAIIHSPTRVEELATLLRQRGFEVLEASKLDEAIKLASSERCHAALIELDCIKKIPGSKEDVFRDLSDALHLTHCFVLCQSTVSTREAEAAFDAGIRIVHSGKTYLKSLPDKIQRVVNQHRAEGLALKWEVLEEITLPAVLSDNERDVHWVLGHLFPTASELRVDSVRGTGRSAVLEGRIDRMASPALIKIGRAVKIQQEIENYERYIHRQLGASFHAMIDRSYCWWNLGGILYTFLGSNSAVESFSDFYQRAETGPVRDVLTRLYERVLRGLYHQDKKLLQDSIYDAYDNYLGLTERLKDIAYSTLGFFELPNPVDWVVSNKHRSHLRQERKVVYETITHGDLWGENILVEGRRCWIVDFERAGLGHALRDFIELEVDILTRLSRFPSEELMTFYDLVIALASPSTVVGYLPRWTTRLKGSEEALKAFNAIDHLRYLADRATSYMDVREYYWGLLLDALFAAALAPAGSRQQKCALLLAAVLCGRLENWGTNEWPPLGWPQVLWEETPQSLIITRGRPPRGIIEQKHTIETFDAFLSYNSDDRNAVQRVAGYLKEAGLNVWLDSSVLRPGDPWQEEIEEALDRSAACVVFWGASGLGPWQHEEMRAALARRVSKQGYRVIPVLLPECRSPKEMPLFLQRIEYVDFRKGLDDQDAIHDLINGIRGTGIGAAAVNDKQT